MSNYDILITNAASYHNPLCGPRQRLALKIYAQAIEFMSTTDYTTASGQRTIVAKAVKDLAGVPMAEFQDDVSPAQVAMWMHAAESGNAGLATASLSSKLGAIPYLLNLDMESLMKTNAYMDGIVTSSIT